MNSSSEPTWAPALDLTPVGVTRLDPSRIEEAVAAGHAEGYREGFAQGHLAGLEAGRAAVDAEAEALRGETAALLASLSTVAERLARSEVATAEELADRAAEVAIRLAAAILGRELADETIAATDAVRRVVASLDRREQVRIQVHPDDLVLLEAAGVPDNVTLDANPGLRRGDAVGRTDDRTVDARLDGALARAAAALEGKQ